MEWLTTSMCAAPVRARQAVGGECDLARDVDVRRVVVVVDGVDLASRGSPARSSDASTACHPLLDPRKPCTSSTGSGRAAACFRSRGDGRRCDRADERDDRSRNTRRRSTGAR